MPANGRSDLIRRLKVKLKYKMFRLRDSVYASDPAVPNFEAVDVFSTSIQRCLNTNHGYFYPQSFRAVIHIKLSIKSSRNLAK